MMSDARHMGNFGHRAIAQRPQTTLPLAPSGARRGEIEKAGGTQLVDARQLIQTVQTKMHEKIRRRHPEERTARAGAPAPGAYPARFHQSVDRTLPESDTPYLFDLGAGDRLVV